MAAVLALCAALALAERRATPSGRPFALRGLPRRRQPARAHQREQAARVRRHRAGHETAHARVHGGPRRYLVIDRLQVRRVLHEVYSPRRGHGALV